MEPLKEGKKPNTCIANCLKKIKNTMLPPLDIEQENEARENTLIQAQLDVIQNTLNELKRSLQGTQPSTSLRKNGEFYRPRRNTTI